MPFKKGNTIWKESVKTKKENKEKIAQFFDIVAGGGITEYANKLDRLAKKAKKSVLTDDEREFMDRFEKLIPYVKPKLANEEITIKHKFEGQDKNELEERAAKLISGALGDRGGTGSKK